MHTNTNRPQYYKVLSADRRACHGGDHAYKLNRWTPSIEPIPCEQGYHLCEEQDLIHWLGEAIHPAKARGGIIRQGDKTVAESILIHRALPTWNERTMRHFAADCAEAVLPIYEKTGESSAPQQVIYAARLFAEGEIGDADRAAAKNAAGAASWAAAGGAAWDAASAAASAAAGATASAAAWAAARAASWAAARAAAWAAALAAAWAAARDGQTANLMRVLWEPEAKEAEWAEKVDLAKREWKGGE